MTPTTTSKGITKIPRQAIPRSKKDRQWKEATIEAIINMSDFGGYNRGLRYTDVYNDGSMGLSRRELLSRCYHYYNGVIFDEDYSHVLRPYGKARQNFPAKLQNYPMIKPTIDLLKGEFIKRPSNATVNVINDDVVNLKHREKSQQFNQVLQQHFVNELTRLGIVDFEQEEAPDPAEFIQNFNMNYRDRRAIQGQKALNFIRVDQELDESKFPDGFFDWLAAGEVYSFRYVIEGQVIYRLLNPLNVDCDKSPDVIFVEDADWALTRDLMTPSDVIDDFHKYLTEDQIRQIEDEDSRRRSETYFYYTDDTSDRNQNSKDRLIEVIRVYWKSRRKFGFATGVDEEGIPYINEVEEGYQKQEGEEVEWFWGNEAWGGIRIDEDIYLDIKPLEIQRQDLDNNSQCKLPINGRVYSNRNAPNISLLMLLIPYQLVYNIYMYRLENKIAKSKDLIALLDINLIPEGDGWDMDKFLYYIDSTGFAFINYAKEGIPPNHQFTLDLTAKELDAYLNLIRFVREQVELLTGVTRQRLGSITQFDLKGTVEQSIIQSSNITEDIFNKYLQFVKRDLKALLDYSKAAWINGKSLSYSMPDGSPEYFMLDGVQHMESEYGVDATNSAKEQSKLNEAKALGQALVQNGAPISSVLDIIDGDNFVELRQKIKDTENLIQQNAQAAQEAEMQVKQAEFEDKERERQHESQENELDRQNKLQIVQIQANTKLQSDFNSRDDNDNGIPDQNEMLVRREESREKIALDNKKLAENKRQFNAKLVQDDRFHKDKVALEKKKINKQPVKSK